MCGVAGIFAYREAAPDVDVHELNRMRDAMASRGPDGAGTWLATNRRVGLAHRRLSIIDLSPNGAQPMIDGACTISFNGEIYNYRELRAELESAGQQFRSKSDTEVILKLYAVRGTEGFAKLRGMYAFLLWDDARRRLVVVRDPYGIKPLYWCDTGGTLRVASQVKALLAGGRVGRETDPVAEASYYLWGFVPEPRTALAAVTAVPPGSVTEFSSTGRAESRVFASVASAFAAAADARDDLAPAEARAAVHAALADSVRQHLVADVPVGVFLSAGIDSTVLLALASRVSAEPLHAVTLAFGEYAGRPEDEVPLARAAAAVYGAHHHVVTIEKTDFTRDIDAIFAAMDQPTIDGVNSYFVSKAAVQAGLKTSLSGLGGDELFGGYGSARDLPRWRRLRSLARVPGLTGGIAAILGGLANIPGLGRRFHRKLVHAPRFVRDDAALYYLKRAIYFPDELPAVMDDDRLRAAFPAADPVAVVTGAVPLIHNDYARIAAQESTIYMRSQLLRDLDWAGMGQSLEVRVPLADWTLLQATAPHLAQRSRIDKSWLAGAVSDLPSAIRRRPKTGFNLPIDRWVTETDDVRGLRVRFGGWRDWAQVVWRRWTSSIGG